jgi:hypothetical protein
MIRTNKGKFYYAKSSEKEFTYEFLFPNINITETGDFIARFYLLMFCNVASCDGMQDTITVVIKDEIDNSQELARKEYFLEDLEFDKQWIQKELKFKTLSDKINVRIEKKIKDQNNLFMI